VARALGLYLRACLKRDPLGCAGLAELYERGVGVSKDEVRASALYKQSCAGKCGRGCYGLGRLYARGRGGLGKDEKLAARVLHLACELDEPRGCHEHARMLLAGKGTPRDPKQARLLLARACRGGVAAACPRKQRPKRVQPYIPESLF
jgi:hypothetical protein